MHSDDTATLSRQPFIRLRLQLAATITDRPMPVNLAAARTTNSRRSLPRYQRRYSKRIPVAKADQLLVVTLRVTIRRRFRAAQGQLLLQQQFERRRATCIFSIIASTYTSFFGLAAPPPSGKHFVCAFCRLWKILATATPFTGIVCM